MIAGVHSLRLEPQRPIVEFTEPAIVVSDISMNFESVVCRMRRWSDPIANGFLRHTIPSTRLPAREVTWALQRLNFSVYPREIVALIGQPGAGKTTLLKLLAKALNPTRGTIQLRGSVSPILNESEPANSTDHVYDILLLDGPGPGRQMPPAWVSLITEALQQSRTAIIATHDLQFVNERCTRAIWLIHGALILDDCPQDATRQFLESAQAQPRVCEKIALDSPI